MKLSDLNSYTLRELKTLPVKTLVSAIEKSNKLYHDKAKPVLSDETYDRVKDVLRKLDPNNPILSSVGATPTFGRKVTLPYPLYSLSKIKPDDVKVFNAWTADYQGPYVVSAKVDGSSIEIVYDARGHLKSIYTRGDGIRGQDITSSVFDHLKIPKTVKIPDLAVRAEVVLSPKTFAKHAPEDAKNPRNTVAGLLNKIKGDKALLSKASVVAFEMINPRKKPSSALKMLEQMGFETVKHVTFRALSIAALTNILGIWKTKYKYEIDGLVVESDQPHKRPSAGTHSPDYVWAFKINSDEDAAETTVLGVEWQPSKHGLLKPVVLVKPVELKGVTVKKATGHNAFFIEHGYRQKDAKNSPKIKPIGKGAKVLLIRSGDVIPHIVDVTKPVAKPDFPQKGTYAWDNNHTDIKLLSHKDNAEVKVKRIASFFSTVGVDFIKSGVVEKLIDNGFDSIIKILRMKPAHFLVIPGFQQKSADKLYMSIQAKIHKIPAGVLMEASGAFGHGFGTKRFDMILQHYPNALSWNLPENQILERVLKVKGFSNTTATKFAKGLPKFINWLNKSKLKPVLPKAVQVRSQKLQGQSVAFTGFRDKVLEAAIIENGGQLASGVSKNTTTLLVSNLRTSSTKSEKARELGISILTAEQFKNKYKLN